MNHKKQLHQNAKFSGILFLFFILFLAVFITICLFIIQYRASQNAPIIKQIGETQNPCRVVLALTYDLEPVDATLISPSGEEYREGYNEEHKDNTLFISTITREKGNWMIQYNKKRNTQIHVKFEAKNVEKLLLEDLKWDLNNKNPSVSFKGNFNNQWNIPFDYDIIVTSYKADCSGVVCDGTSKTGRQVTAKLNMKNMKKADDYRATLNIYISDKSIIQTGDMEKSSVFSYTPPKKSVKQKTSKRSKINGKTGRKN